mmetsp:Transcript_57385/g.117487  ORF Transcript_57385/g.117487 Transcript_57385/m.117487 type:complete len:499 (+) Transcript_57385:140-1636(+)
MCSRLQGRRERSKLHFVAHETTICFRELKLVEKVNLAEEFFSAYPLPYNLQELVQDLYAFVLTDEQLDQCHPFIVISSYRWKGMMLPHGAPDNEEGRKWTIPTSFGWFLEWIKGERKVGWIDFVANIGVNVPVPVVINDMGPLYNNFVVLGEWLSDIESLGESEKRGWIHQECAYGELERSAAAMLLAHLRSAYLNAVAPSANLDALCQFYRVKGLVQRLLACRSLQTVDNSELHQFFTAKSGPEGALGNIITTFRQRFGLDEMRQAYGAEGPLMSAEAMQLLSIVFSQDDSTYAKVQPVMLDMLCKPVIPRLGSVEAVVARFARSIVTGYLSRRLTYEQDRDDALTGVVRSTIQAQLKVKLSAQELLALCWEELLCQLPAGRNEVICPVEAPSVVQDDSIEVSQLRLEVQGECFLPAVARLIEQLCGALFQPDGRCIDQHGREVRALECRPVQQTGDQPVIFLCLVTVDSPALSHVYFVKSKREMGRIFGMSRPGLF